MPAPLLARDVQFPAAMVAIESMMKQELVTATPADTVADVTRRMSDAGVGAVLIVADGALRGVFTERDALNRVLAAGLDPTATQVGAVATEATITVRPQTHVRECVALLQTHRIRHLPVVDDGKPVGVVSARDFFARVAVGLEDWIEQRRYESKLSEGDDPYDHVGGSYGK